MTGYEGKTPQVSRNMIAFDTRLDCLHFTVTSRKEMPNAQFVQEIAKAAEDLHALHKQVARQKAKL